MSSPENRSESRLDTTNVAAGGHDGLIASPKEQCQQSQIANQVNEQQQAKSAEKYLPDATIQQTDAALQVSDPPSKDGHVDVQKRTATVEYEGGKTRVFKFDSQYQISEYKDKNGHTWVQGQPDEWKRTDGKDVMHGKFALDPKYAFSFINYDKNYVSNYGSSGEEKLNGRKPLTSCTQDELEALKTTTNKFVNCNFPQNTTEHLPKAESQLKASAPGDGVPKVNTEAKTHVASVEEPAKPSTGVREYTPAEHVAPKTESPAKADIPVDGGIKKDTKEKTHLASVGEPEKPTTNIREYMPGLTEKPKSKTIFPDDDSQTSEKRLPPPEPQEVKTPVAVEAPPAVIPEANSNPISKADQGDGANAQDNKPTSVTENVGTRGKDKKHKKDNTDSVDGKDGGADDLLKDLQKTHSDTSQQQSDYWNVDKDTPAKPLTEHEVDNFAATFPAIPRAEIARISHLSLAATRSEMQKEDIMSRKRLLYGEMVYRLTDGFTNTAYPQDGEPQPK